MQFKSLTNIESAFRHLRLFGIVFLCTCALLTGYAVWCAYDFAEAQRQKIYVLEHVRHFHELFFTLSPDKAAIESNIQRALYLADRTAFEHYRDLAEKGYYNRIISGNINQRIIVDSVVCNFDRYPYDVQTYARQRIIRQMTVTERSLITHGQLMNTQRSDNNPHGFILEGFRIIENRDMTTYDR